MSSAIAVTAALGALAGLAEAGGGDHGGGRHRDCPGIEHLSVPGAEHLEAACLEDLTTAGTVKTGHIVPADFAGLSVPGTINPIGVSRHPTRRLLPGHLDVQHDARLEP